MNQLVFQCGKLLLGLPVRHLEIEGIGTEINAAWPDQLPRFSDLNLSEFGIILSPLEHTTADQFAKIDDATCAIRKRHIQAVVFQCLHLSYRVHTLSPS